MIIRQNIYIRKCTNRHQLHFLLMVISHAYIVIYPIFVTVYIYMPYVPPYYSIVVYENNVYFCNIRNRIWYNASVNWVKQLGNVLIE